LNPREIVECKKSLAAILSNRALGLFNEKKFTEAIADLNEALELDPDGMYYHRQRASCYYNSNDFERALTDFTEAIRREPNNSTYYLNRAYCLQAMGKNEEAAKDFDKSKELGGQP